MRYIAILGFNTKQWWVYDEETDIYIDPPSEVLEEIASYSDNVDEQEEYFNALLEKEPEWLNDDEYWSDAEEIDI